MNYSSFMINRYTRSMAAVKCIAAFLSIFIPFTILAIAIKNQWPVIAFIGLLFSGWLLWTFAEYMIHRFRTHQESGDSAEERFKRHLHHHKHPTEIKVTARQRFILLISCMCLLAISVWLNNFFTMLTGFVIGFSYSFFSHWMLHQPWSKKIFPHLHHFHIHHHCKYPDKCFGFSTTLWDHVFGTIPPKDANITERIKSFYYGREAEH